MVLHKQMIDTTTELSVLPFDFAVFQKDIVFIDNSMLFCQKVIRDDCSIETLVTHTNMSLSNFYQKMEENHMEETNVTMTTEEMQGEPAAKENETKAEKFIRIGEYRMNKAVDAIGRLENLANRGSYEYTREQVDAMFQRLSLK